MMIGYDVLPKGIDILSKPALIDFNDTDPKYKGPYKMTVILVGYRYLIKALNSERSYKYGHDQLK